MTLETPPIHSQPLEYLEYGAKNGTPVVFFHGFLSSGRDAALMHSAALDLNLRILAINRPGYGRSQPRPLMGLKALAPDIWALMQSLGISRFSLLAVSGGAPYAIATAATLPPEVIDKVCIINGLGPAYPIQLTENLPTRYRLNLWMALNCPTLLKPFYSYIKWQFQRDPAGFFKSISLGLTERDREALNEVSTFQTLLDSVHDSLAQGAHSALMDVMNYSRPWGLALSQIQVPIFFNHGDRDTVVPMEMAEFLAQQIPNSRFTTFAGEGHYSLPLRHGHQILSQLC